MNWLLLGGLLAVAVVLLVRRQPEDEWKILAATTDSPVELSSGR